MQTAGRSLAGVIASASLSMPDLTEARALAALSATALLAEVQPSAEELELFVQGALYIEQTCAAGTDSGDIHRLLRSDIYGGRESDAALKRLARRWRPPKLFEPDERRALSELCERLWRPRDAVIFDLWQVAIVRGLLQREESQTDRDGSRWITDADGKQALLRPAADYSLPGFAAWARRRACHEMRSLLGRTGLNPEVYADFSDEAEFAEIRSGALVPPELPDPLTATLELEREQARAAAISAINEALNSPPRKGEPSTNDRQTFRLRYVEELSRDEIADRLKITTNNVDQRLTRVRQWLRTCLPPTLLNSL